MQMLLLNKFEQDRYRRSKTTEEIRFTQKTRWPPIFFSSFCHYIVNWCTEFEQNRYRRSKTTAEIRFAQKTRWPPKNINFRFVIL